MAGKRPKMNDLVLDKDITKALYSFSLVLKFSKGASPGSQLNQDVTPTGDLRHYRGSETPTLSLAASFQRDKITCISLGMALRG
jgi:hypothetical protein